MQAKKNALATPIKRGGGGGAKGDSHQNDSAPASSGGGITSTHAAASTQQGSKQQVALPDVSGFIMCWVRVMLLVTYVGEGGSGGGGLLVIRAVLHLHRGSNPL